MTEQSATCPNCGAGHHSEKAWTKCECGDRIWFDDGLRKKFGSDSPPRAFLPDRSERTQNEHEQEEDEETVNARLDDFG